MNKNSQLSLDQFYNTYMTDQLNLKNNYDNEKVKYSDKNIERNDEELLKPEKYNLDISYQLRCNMDYSKMLPNKLITDSKLYDGNTYMLQNIKRIPLDTTKYLNPQNMVGRGFGTQSYPDNYGIYTRQLEENTNPRSIIYENRNFQTNGNLLYSNYIEDNIDRGGKDTRYLNKKSLK